MIPDKEKDSIFEAGLFLGLVIAGLLVITSILCTNVYNDIYYRACVCGHPFGQHELKSHLCKVKGCYCEKFNSKWLHDAWAEAGETPIPDTGAQIVGEIERDTEAANDIKSEDSGLK